MEDFNLVVPISVGILAIILYKAIYFYAVTVKEYPPGPTPLPFVGNTLPLIKNMLMKMHVYHAIEEVSKTYGPVFTLWLGHIPFVYVVDTKAVIHVLKSNSFAGRPDVDWIKFLNCTPESIAILSSDYSKDWEVLRKISYSAVRKSCSAEILTKNAITFLD